MNNDSDAKARGPNRELITEIRLSSGGIVRLSFETWPGGSPPSLRIERVSATGNTSTFAIAARQRDAFLEAVKTWSAAIDFAPPGDR